jgi:hypothetical protein
MSLNQLTTADMQPAGESERWLPCPGWEGFYEISDCGRVRSVNRTINTSAGPKRYQGRILSPGRKGKGYLIVQFWRVGRPTHQAVHQLVLEAFVGPCPQGLEGCHNDGNPSNNHLSNLRYDTHINNCLDTVLHGANWQSNKISCPREHLLIKPNLVAAKLYRGHRVCLACQRASANQSEARKRGLPFDFKAAADEHYRKIIGAELNGHGSVDDAQHWATWTGGGPR